jgi:alkylresorcinol/alkylpyrone synthase
MFMTGLGTAAPPGRFTQRECWEFAKSSPPLRELTPRAQAIVKRILLGDNGTVSRHLALGSLEEIWESSPDALHRRFVDHAPRLATAAAQRALQDSGCVPNAIDAVVVSTCTGYLCPGLTSYLSERLSLRGDTLLLDLVGQGCGAALPNMRTAEALLASRRAQQVLSVCVEVCSAAFYLDDDPGVLVSACLFGDGAGAAVLSMDPLPGRKRIEWLSANTNLSPADRDYLRFELRQGKLRNILTKQVPELAGKYAEIVLAEVLDGRGLNRSEIAAWIFHAAGREVLLAVGERLGLDDHDLRWSASILREYGNLSSASLFFVIESALTGGAPGGYWWLSSFGAGFSCHGALLGVSTS